MPKTAKPEAAPKAAKTTKAAPPKAKKPTPPKADDGRGIPTKVDVIDAGGGLLVEVATPAAVAVEAPVEKPAPKPKKVAETATAEPAPAPADAPKGKPLGRSAVATLTALAAKGKLSRAQIAESIGVNSGFTSLLGHVDPAKREPGSLAARGLIAPEAVEGSASVVWVITDAGKKVLAEAKK
mgnify:CR=1 FL=1